MLYLLTQSGQACTITSRTPNKATQCVLTPSAKSGWRVMDRSDYWDILLPTSVSAGQGETVSVKGREVTIMSFVEDIRGITRFLSGRINAHLNWQHPTPSTDASYNIITTWPTVSASVPSFGQLVTAQLRQEDPGLMQTTKYLFFIPSTYKIPVMDRVIFNTVSCQVDALDDIILDGILRLQCSVDTRV